MGLDHLEAAGGGAGGFELAVKGDHLADFEAAFEVGAVEPHALERGEALADGHLEEGAGAGAEEGGAANLGDDGGHGSGDEVCQRDRVEAVLVAKGEVVEEVFDSLDPALGEALGDAVADALDELDGGGEVEHKGDGSKAREHLCGLQFVILRRT